jgi:tetratricopeptide (TPR) repeat protein
VRACYAALAMQESIRHYSEEVRHSHGVEVQIRVGLNSGEVVVRAIGNDLHMDYSAIGQTTHLAARMEQLAHHALRGKVWEKAVAYCRQAGAKAYARAAHQEAAARFEQALVALQHLPARRDMCEQALELHFDLRNALHHLAEHARILAHLRQAKPLAEALGNQHRLGQIACYMASCLGHLGDAAGGLASAQRALAMATEAL